MGKIFGYHLGFGLLGNLAVLVLTEILAAVVKALLAWITGLMFPLIVGIIGGAIAGIIASVFIANGNAVYFDDNDKSKFTNIWRNIAIDNSKKIRIGKILLMLLPFIAICVISAFFAIKQFPIISKYQSVQEHENMIPVMLGAVALMNTAIFWLVYAICIMVHYIQSRCKCGTVMCYVLGEALGAKEYVITDTKSKDTYGKIGDVYSGDEKIGEVRSSSSYTLERERLVHVTTYSCHCIFCGKEKRTEQQSSRILKDWH